MEEMEGKVRSGKRPVTTLIRILKFAETTKKFYY
jgi:hypothetical protein